MVEKFQYNLRYNLVLLNMDLTHTNVIQIPNHLYTNAMDTFPTIFSLRNIVYLVVFQRSEAQIQKESEMLDEAKFYMLDIGANYSFELVQQLHVENSVDFSVKSSYIMAQPFYD